MEEERCGPGCRTITATPRRMTPLDRNEPPSALDIVITKTCDHLPPRVLLSEPRQIQVRVQDFGVDHWAMFKAQCWECRTLFGGHWVTLDPRATLPSDDLVRRLAALLLVADGCQESADGWRCAACQGVPSDRRLLLAEGSPPVPLEGWPSEGG